VTGSRDAARAARPAVDVNLRNGEYVLTLSVDVETGVWTYLRVGDLTITVDDLAVGDLPVAPALGLLDAVPDIDLSQREPVTAALAPVLQAVEQASGLQVEVLDQDEQTKEFRFVLLADGQPSGVVSRRHVQQAQSQQIFGGVQHHESGPEWECHVDTSGTDHRWANGIMRAFANL